MLGLGSNRNLSNVHLNLSSVDLQSQGIQNLQNSLSQLNNITSLNISNIGEFRQFKIQIVVLGTVSFSVDVRLGEGPL